MASKEDDLKVVRCTYSELKELAETLEKPRSRNNRGSRTTPSNSAKKTKETPRDETKNKVKGGTNSSKERVVSRQQKTLPDRPRKEKDLPAEKASGSSKKKGVAKKVIPKEQNRTTNNKNGLINTKTIPGQTTVSKTVTFDVQNTKESSESEGDINEYDRGLISPNRLLYDPAVSKQTPRSNNGKTLVQNDLCSNDDFCRNMERLSTNDSTPLATIKSNLQDSPAIPHTQTNSKKVNKQVAETLLADIDYLEADLDNLLSRRINSKEQLGHVTKLSCQVEEKCKAIMLTDLYVFTTREVYHILWRNGIYQVIEKLRMLQKSSQDDENWTSEVSCVLQEFLDSTSTFITSLITSLEDKHKFLLKSFLDAPNQFDDCSRAVKMALRSCHHFMIFLGDIERYKQNLASSKEWSVARSYYLKASKIAPRNGKPYNQLAVIAVYAKRRLDAVYYYVRSLSVSNPIMTAREKLHAIFDDVQRKAYDLHVSAQMERERQENELAHNARDYNTRQNWRQGRRRHNSTSRASVHDRRTTEEGRHEVWVFYQSGTRREFLFTPNGLLKGQQNQKEINEKKEKPNSKISLNEINKQFEIFFLCCHAMLFSKIGVDHFLENHRKTLGLFRTLLRHPASPAVRMKRLVEVIAINMFEIENVAHEDYGQFMEGTPLDLALNLGSDMFACLCKAASDVIKSSENNSDQEACHVPVLTNYVPAIKTWFDWMQQNISLLRSSSVSIKEEFWNSIGVLLNNLNGICGKASPVVPGEIIATLPEDDHLNGFNLLAQASKPRSNVDSDLEKEMVYRLLRNEAVQSIAKFLCEFEDLPLRFDESSETYYVTDIMTNTTSEENQETGNEIDEDDIEDDVIIESVEDIDSDEELPSPVRELKAKKDALTKEILNQKQREEEAQAVLVEHSSKPTLVLEINPQYLVPDTNCFIDHLPGLQYIVESRYFTVVIPLVVINELDGLAKGFSAADIDQQQRADYVAYQARAAVDFLEYSFSLTDQSQMLALTSKGSVLSTIAFRSEEPTAGRGINDDVILNCCTHYCDAKMDVVNKLATADQPFTIRRKVVLLTEDRNLRLKAHVQNIPVVTVPQFLEMIVP